MNSFTVGVFSCERIAAHFPPLWRTILLRRRQRKVRLSEGRPILVTFHLFLVLVGGTNIFSELISSLKIAKLCFETTAAHATIIKRTQLSFLPLREPGGTPPSWMDRKRYPRIKEMNLGLKKCKDTQNTSLD